MEENQIETVNQTRPRKRRKSLSIPPRQPLPIKLIWNSASEEEKTLAHQRAVALMEYWMGQTSKTEIAKRLGIPTLRVWQLSQQAIAGMLAGLLKQPKVRKKMLETNLEIDPKKLMKRIAELEKTVADQDRLIAVLRMMPGCRDVSIPMEEPLEEEKSDVRTISARTQKSSGKRPSGKKTKRGCEVVCEQAGSEPANDKQLEE